jgi:ectoine hydroxylase-related dioxygenase (phytanoyl-CoA dioxygenase family)
MAQLYRSTPANGVWVIPGSHVGKVDIAALAAKAGSDRLPDAVPIVCGAGDVAMTNRQIVHGSFPNESADPRITINFGFHRRSSVLGAVGAGIHSKSVVYDEARIRERSRVIGYAIDARRQRFPDESPYEYRPFVESGDTFRWDDHARTGLKDYNLLDLSI